MPSGFGVLTGIKNPRSSERGFFHYSLFTAPQGSQSHAARGRNGRQEGRERGYYYLHRNLNDSLFHTLFVLKLKGS